MTDETKPLTVRNHLLEHEDEPPEPYQVKNIDLKLLDDVSEKIVYLLVNEKKLRPIDKSDAIKALGAIQGVGKEGEDFHNLSEQEQNGLLGQMYYAENLGQMNEAFMVKMEYKPAMPAAPSGPQFGFVPMGPGMGGMGGMQPMAPSPPSPMPYAPQQTPPPYYPPHAYPTYPPQTYQTAPGHPPYPPPHDPNAVQGQGYAQPHPYPSYPVPPQQPGQPGYAYPPQPGYPPQGGYPPQQPWPPQGHSPHGQPPQGGYPPQWPPQQPQPVIIEAEEARDDDKPKPANDSNADA